MGRIPTELVFWLTAKDTADPYDRTHVVWHTGLPVNRKWVDFFGISGCLTRRVPETRHACDQGDNLDSYTWTEYDTREGGVQVIKDSFNNVKLTTEFLKVAGGEHGGSWAARIKGEPLDKGPFLILVFVTLIFP
jgi:hypothetical protein